MDTNKDEIRTPATNTGFASGGVTCKLGALCFYSSSVLAVSLVLRNPPERKARKRYQIFIKPNSMIEEFTLWSTIQTKSKCYVIKKY